ncbi:MAG TPA: type II secretion system protein [Flavobacterium sp.]|nr:type II secretion system protein [Flavobacterium sp.]
MNLHAKKKRKKGYAMLELLFYIAIFSVLSVALTEAVITMTKSFRETSIQREFTQSAGIMERMSREIKSARGINSISSSSLTLDATDEAGEDKTVTFSLSGGSVQVTENGTLIGNLNSENTEVTGLVFTEITTAEGKAVRVSLSIRVNADTQNRVQDFHNTLVLRGDY